MLKVLLAMVRKFMLRMQPAFFEWGLLCASRDCGLHVNKGPLNAAGSASSGLFDLGVVALQNIFHIFPTNTNVLGGCR